MIWLQLLLCDASRKNTLLTYVYFLLLFLDELQNQEEQHNNLANDPTSKSYSHSF